jgi:hypothetical protein
LQQLRGVECTSVADDGAAVFAAIAVLHSDCAYPPNRIPCTSVRVLTVRFFLPSTAWR